MEQRAKQHGKTHHGDSVSLHAMKAYILNFCTRWKWVVSFTPQRLYVQKKVPSVHWVGGWVSQPQSRFGHFWKRINFWPVRASNHGLF